MPRESFNHIFVQNAHNVDDYISAQRGGGERIIPKRDRKEHGEFLKRCFGNLWKEFQRQNKDKAVCFTDRKGLYVEFKIKAGCDSVIKSLEKTNSQVRILNVRKEGEELFVTLYLPIEKRSFLLNKIDMYLTQETKKKGLPKNKPLINSIDSIKLAVLESFWQDNKALIPNEKESVGCEVWLRVSSETDEAQRTIDDFLLLCERINVKYNENQKIYFPERSVVLIYANKKQLIQIIKNSDVIAEFRRVKETARFWIKQSNIEQSQWVQELKERIEFDEDSQVSVCLLDTGVNNGHPLIGFALLDSDCHSIRLDEWGIDDREGHGTLMSGLILYGDLQRTLESGGKVIIPQRLESVKLIPSSGQHNEKNLYGDVTKQGISRAEIQRPDYKRIICMAITSDENDNKGRPSSWSGALDQISSGAEDEKRRLIILAAGNVQSENWTRYPEANLNSSVQDPSQSWNCLVVGAFTEKVDTQDLRLEGYKTIAQRGQLSPFSTTSFFLCWDQKKWPNKPDIVFEGGNVAIDSRNFVSSVDDLSLLSLHNRPQERQFSAIYATSAASAQAAWMAGQIQARYPHIWPETVRALMIHSANWTREMTDQFWDEEYTPKENYKNLLGIFGYGIPDIDNALASYTNNLVLVSQQELQPFKKRENGSGYCTKDMHFYKMPWPKEVLEELEEKEVKLKFTLSYFVEPGPGEIGWGGRYRYSSYGLRFFLIRPLEAEEDFKKRINDLARDDEEKYTDSTSGDNWLLGNQNRNKGSIHSDIWIGTAREIAECGLMAVCPINGWWKERHYLKKWDKKARYSLIVSLSTQEQEIDLYTPVALKIGIPIRPSRK